MQDIEALAASLVSSPDRFEIALAGTQTRWFTPAKAWRANIVYLTFVRGKDGGLADVGDPYHVDEALAAALDHRKRSRAMVSPVTIAMPTGDQRRHAAATDANASGASDAEQPLTNTSTAMPANVTADQ